MEESNAVKMPVAFLSHGAPTLALDAGKGAEFRDWARDMPRPEALLVVSAHWEETPLRIGTVEPDGLLHDFGGFDGRLYEIEYAAPGAPDLADRVSRMVGGPHRENVRMWDHGVWVPLIHMYPDADIPVLQLSLPSGAEVADLVELGRLLAPLRDEGVLILGSGGMVHNLRRIDWSDELGPESWALEFEEWVRGVLEEHDVDTLIDFRKQAPALRYAHPTLEHFLPLLVVVGAAQDAERVRFPIEGFEYGSLSRGAVELA